LLRLKHSAYRISQITRSSQTENGESNIENRESKHNVPRTFALANKITLVILRNFFRSKPKPDPSVRPELISVHIPKTAGTSFRHILKQVYGESAVVRLDINARGKKVRLDEQLYEAAELPAGVRVLHGHFSPAAVAERFAGVEKLPAITWLRHPVDRVISNYFYLKKRLAEELDEEAKGLNILRKMQRSLLEYAADDMNRNRQHKFLAGRALEDFAFVAIQEHYDEDLAAMGKHLGWPPVEAVKYNVTGTGPQVTDEDRATIAALNPLDMALYEHGVALRERRLGVPKIKLISLHLPKTGGTSFHRSLQQAYGEGVTDSLKRRDVERMTAQYADFDEALPANIRAIHGHLNYAEVAELHRHHAAKIICWLREPVARLVSNHRFFLAGLTDPDRNRAVYEANKHRAGEDLLTYARREENRNVMHKMLAGLELADYDFVGLLEDYDADLDRLAELLGWEPPQAHHLNQGAAAGAKNVEGAGVIDDLRRQLLELNAADVALYQSALQLRPRP
jgi:hypothetical protein